ncbi:hypothetical protein CGT78_06605 [Vibrio cholerae]|nr:hypothetical protein CGT78_06605 [Vibrio cholerae]
MLSLCGELLLLPLLGGGREGVLFPASLNLYHKGIGAGELPHPNPPLKGEGIQINPLLLQRGISVTFRKKLPTERNYRPKEITDRKRLRPVFNA